MKPFSKISELNVCGWQAVSTLFARHPGDVLRLFFDPTTGKRAGEMCSLLAKSKRVYRQVPPAELEKVAGTVHHGGIVAVIAARPLRRVTREVRAPDSVFSRCAPGVRIRHLYHDREEFTLVGEVRP